VVSICSQNTLKADGEPPDRVRSLENFCHTFASDRSNFPRSASNPNVINARIDVSRRSEPVQYSARISHSSLQISNAWFFVMNLVGMRPISAVLSCYVSSSLFALSVPETPKNRNQMVLLWRSMSVNWIQTAGKTGSWFTSCTALVHQRSLLHLNGRPGFPPWAFSLSRGA